MTDHESQPVLTRQLAAECDMLRLRSAAHERTEAELRRELADLYEHTKVLKRNAVDARKLAGDAIEASDAKQCGIDKLRAENANLREQVKMYKESLRLIQQMRRAEG